MFVFKFVFVFMAVSVPVPVPVPLCFCVCVCVCVLVCVCIRVRQSVFSSLFLSLFMWFIPVCAFPRSKLSTRFCDCIKQDGSTMMHIAAQAGHPDTAMVFLKKGVPLHMPNKVISYVSCDSVVVTIR